MSIESFDIRSHIVDSMVETFDTMVSMEIEVSASEAPDTAGLSRMVAAVDFAGHVIGRINIQVTSELCRRMRANMLEIELEELEDDGEIKNMLAEITNMVGGNLKSALNDAGHTCEISTPSLTYGADFSIKSLSMERFERFVFSWRQELIIVEVGLKTRQISAEGDDLSSKDSLSRLNQVDVEKINGLNLKAIVSDSVMDVFDTMLSAKLEITDKISPDSLEKIRGVGSVSFAGDATGMVSIHVGDNYSRELAAGMLGMEIGELEGEVEIRDMLGELSNIVGGNLKSTFNDCGLVCSLSIPSFTTGTDFKIESLNMEKYERFAFRCDDNIVFVEMGVKISELVQAAGHQGEDIHYSLNSEADAQSAAQHYAAGAPAAEKEAADTTAVEPAPELRQPPPDADRPSENRTSALQAQTASEAPVQKAKPEVPEREESPTPGDFDLELLFDIPLEIKVELGRASIQIQELLTLAPGSAVKLFKLEGEPVDILANDTLIARGEVVVQREKYGIRVTEITSRMDRIRSFSI
jgi:flagellar motor switch protein FliN/FliY